MLNSLDINNRVMAACCLCSSLLALKGCHLSSVFCHHNSEKKGRGISSSLTRAALLVQFWECREAVSANNSSAFSHSQNLSRSTMVCSTAVDDNGGATNLAATKGRQLWRSELKSASELSNNKFESLDGAATLERNIERFAKKDEREKLWSQSANWSRNGQAPDEQKGGGVIRDVVDKILVADFFFVLFILAWLLTGLAEQGALESSRLIDSWLPLWPSMFQPALGVFMAGAMVFAITKTK